MRELDEDDEDSGNNTGPSSPAPGISGRSRSNTASGGRSRSNTVDDQPSGSSMFGSKKKGAPPPIPSKSSKSGSRGGAAGASAPRAQIDLAKERPKIQQTLAEASSAATNLMNALQLINWERELSTENKRATECFNKCRRLRKNVLRYIHSIESEEFIGSLIHANEELIQALQKYDKMSTAMDDDSDSDYENDDWKVESGMRKMNISKRNESDGESVSDSEEEGPGRSSQPSRYRQQPAGKQKQAAQYDVDEDDDNPFGDSNVIKDDRSYGRY